MALALWLPDRVVARLGGDGALNFVHDVSTQDVLQLRPGTGTMVAFLTDKGRLLADARCLVTDDGVMIDAEQAAREGLETALRAAPLASVDVEVGPAWHHARITGDPRELEAMGFRPPTQPYGLSIDDGVICVAAGWGAEGYDILAPDGDSIRARLDRAGPDAGDPAGAEEVRIAAGRPAFGVDVDATTLINETPLLVHAVSSGKGCYPGQESVARVRNLGRVKRMLRVLDTSGPVERGAEVVRGPASVGRVTSAARTHALAFVSADVEPGTDVTVGGVSAAVTDAGWS